MEKLTKLTVSGHPIATLPPKALASFKLLVLLDLSQCKLGGGGGGQSAFLADAAK